MLYNQDVAMYGMAICYVTKGRDRRHSSSCVCLGRALLLLYNKEEGGKALHLQKDCHFNASCKTKLVTINHYESSAQSWAADEEPDWGKVQNMHFSRLDEQLTVDGENPN